MKKLFKKYKLDKEIADSLNAIFEECNKIESMNMFKKIFSLRELLQNQYDSHNPLTKEMISKLINKETKLGTSIKPGDRLFHIIIVDDFEPNQITKKFTILTEYEFSHYEKDFCLFSEYDTIPELWNLAVVTKKFPKFKLV